MLPNEQPPDPHAAIKAKYGSVTNFYRDIAKQTNTTPEQVMEEVEKMQPSVQSPQSSAGMQPNTATPVSQVANGPTPVNPAAMGAQSQQLQGQGMAPAQAQNQAATNPSNQMGMKKGGATGIPGKKPIQTPPTPDDISNDPRSKDSGQQVAEIMKAMGSMGLQKGQPATPPTPSAPPRVMQQDDSTPNYGGYAKGGDVHSKMGELKLKDIMQMLATHPGMSGEPQPSAQAPTSGYAKGGPTGLLGMASGGTLEEDQMQGFDADGTPLEQNADGSESDADINQYLDRPKSASTLGTGQDPTNSLSKNIANAPSAAPIGMAMGGEADDSDAGIGAAPPPGSLTPEVSDDIDANLSPGEFVMSADATRFWGLQKLHAMQDFARQSLDKLNQSGGIRSPGDGKNSPQGGQFMQDQTPNDQWYSPDEKGQGSDEPDGDETPPGAACGGLMKMATGGTAEEEQFATGGVVSSKGVDLAPFAKSESAISTPATKLPAMAKPAKPRQSVRGPHVNINKKPNLGFAKGGGLLRSVNQPQSIED